jgi:hypothetical protein
MSSTQSILELNRERYLHEAEQELLQMSDAYFYKVNFLLGEGVDRDKMNFSLQAEQYLNTEECEMLQFISDKIEGKLEPNKKKTSKRRLHELLEQFRNDFGCTDAEVLEACCNWETLEW